MANHEAKAYVPPLLPNIDTTPEEVRLDIEMQLANRRERDRKIINPLGEIDEACIIVLGDPHLSREDPENEFTTRIPIYFFSQKLLSRGVNGTKRKTDTRSTY